jgi:hypothetical protein
VNGTHVESPASEVPEPQASALRTIMRDAAEKWWQSVVMEPHSLEKPQFYLGLENGLVTNMLVSGAHERTAENVRLIPNGAAGFKVAGDRICFKLQVRSRLYHLTCMLQTFVGEFQVSWQSNRMYRCLVQPWMLKRML